jgi:nicotinamidase-related amidase
MSKSALVIIDLQNDYYAGGDWTLHNIDKATSNASKVLAESRNTGNLVVHIHHEFQSEDAPFFKPRTYGAKIHENVRPIKGEPTVLKHYVNAFKETNLKDILEENNITHLTLIGAMSHMCIDAAARAASDFGYQVTVIEDACASRDLEFKDKVVPAEQVHSAYMSALGFAYASITTTHEFLTQSDR